MHLVAWGSVDSQVEGPVDVTIGLPRDALRRLGLDAPPGHVLPIRIGGTSDAYQASRMPLAEALQASLLAGPRCCALLTISLPACELLP